MIRNKIVLTALLCGAASAGLACENPPLAQVPTSGRLNDREKERVREAVAEYFEALKAYTACVQAELAAAGGDDAPVLTKNALIARNNGAVAEAEAVLRLFNANIGGGEPSGPPPPTPGLIENR